MTNLSVTAIVPAYNAGKTIAECIEALINQQLDRPLEIIVVDDGSTDATATVVNQYVQRGVRLLQLAHSGAGVARNAGIAEAHGELLLFTDADCAPSVGWAASFVKAFEAQPDLAAAKGVYCTRQRGMVARFVQAEYADRYRRMAKAKSIDFVDTYSAAYRYSVLQVENFDARFPGAIVEDAELAFRLAKRGMKMQFVPDAVVYHQHVNSIGRYFRRKFRIGYWRVAVYKQHPEKLRGDSHTPQVAKLQMLLVTLKSCFLLLGLVSKRLRKPGVTKWSWRTTIATSTLYIASTLPFIKYTWQYDKVAALAAPLMLFVRSLALASGAIAGIVNLIKP